MEEQAQAIDPIKGPSDVELGPVKEKRKSWVVKGASILIFLAAYAIAYSVFGALFPHTPSLEKDLADASNEINKSTPKTIDSITQLTTTTALGNELDYYYKVTSTEHFTQSDLDTALKGNVIKGVCTTEETRDILNKGATLGYRYYDSEGASIGKFSVTVSDCK